MGVLATAQLPETPMINTHIFENQLYHDLPTLPLPILHGTTKRQRTRKQNTS